MPRYQAKTGARSYDLTSDAIDALDLQPTGPSTFHLLHKATNYDIELLSVDRPAKTVHLSINGRQRSYRLLDEVDQQIDALGFSTAGAAASKDLLAPMPGLVLDVMVATGQEISAGTPLVILEAMKMENVLKAEGNGTVKELKIKQGDAVEKKQLLVVIE